MSTPVPATPTPHLKLTSNKHREKTRAVAKLVSVKDETPTIKSFVFRVEGVIDDANLDPKYMAGNVNVDSSLEGIKKFTFKPGQWVDFFVASTDIVGGFSITSTPTSLEQNGTFELAIKQAYVNPVVKWLHGVAKPGDTVQVRVGGGFYLREDPDSLLSLQKLSQHTNDASSTTSSSMATTPSSSPISPRSSSSSSGRPSSSPALRSSTSSSTTIVASPSSLNLPPLPQPPMEILLIAGGVGATPLISIATHIAEVNSANATKATNIDHLRPQYKATFLHSVKETSEMLFKERLIGFSERPETHLDVRYFITRDENSGNGKDDDVST
ncbi:Oxidoreductase NAD-binding domain-containing protein 1 [Blyttiomyces sp. JEL0837]|nr:Oxidoreductase NAD-binding domain-containing protein 1 [Blyttiomyces sp. JEL0837]